MRNRIKTATLAIAASGLLAGAVPASAATTYAALTAAPAEASASAWNHGRGRGHGHHRHHGGYRGDYGQSNYDDRGGYDRGYTTVRSGAVMTGVITAGATTAPPAC